MKATNDKILKDLLHLKEDYTLNLEKTKDKDNLILEAGSTEQNDEDSTSLDKNDEDSTTIEKNDEESSEKSTTTLNPEENLNPDKSEDEEPEESSKDENSKKILNFETPEVADLYSKMKKAKTPSEVALATKSFLDYISEAATKALNS